MPDVDDEEDRYSSVIRDEKPKGRGQREREKDRDRPSGGGGKTYQIPAKRNQGKQYQSPGAQPKKRHTKEDDDQLEAGEHPKLDTKKDAEANAPGARHPSEIPISEEHKL